MICGSDQIPDPVVRQGKPVAATACPVFTHPAWVAALDLWVKRKQQFTTMSSPACVIKGVHKQLGTSNHLIHFKSLQEEGNNYGLRSGQSLAGFQSTRVLQNIMKYISERLLQKFGSPETQAQCRKARPGNDLCFLLPLSSAGS